MIVFLRLGGGFLLGVRLPVGKFIAEKGREVKGREKEGVVRRKGIKMEEEGTGGGKVGKGKRRRE